MKYNMTVFTITSILMDVFQVNLCQLFQWQFPSSACSGREPLWISGTGLKVDQMAFQSPSQQCRSMEGSESTDANREKLPSGLIISSSTTGLREKGTLYTGSLMPVP